MYSGAPKIFVMRSPIVPPISRTVICSGTLPLIVFVTDIRVSVQILFPPSTGVALTTVASTMTGDLSINCSSVGIPIVVALATTARNSRTHVSQYTLL